MCENDSIVVSGDEGAAVWCVIRTVVVLCGDVGWVSDMFGELWGYYEEGCGPP